MGLGNRLISSILVEFPPGYIFAPYGAYGKAYIIARTSSSLVVKGASFFCFSALGMIAFIVAAGIHARSADAPMSFVIAAALGITWIAVYFLWAKLATRGQIEYPRHSSGADNAL
jgi:hypothetical protein